MDEAYSSFFGFIYSEVGQMLNFYGIDGKESELRE